MVVDRHPDQRQSHHAPMQLAHGSLARLPAGARKTGCRMVESYRQTLHALLTRLASTQAPGTAIACKHFFGGAAGYADGRIFISLTPAGLALKLPEEARLRLIEEGRETVAILRRRTDQEGLRGRPGRAGARRRCPRAVDRREYPLCFGRADPAIADQPDRGPGIDPPVPGPGGHQDAGGSRCRSLLPAGPASSVSIWLSNWLVAANKWWSLPPRRRPRRRLPCSKPCPDD